MVLVAMSVFILYLTFAPVVREEIKYQFSAKDNNLPVVTKEEEMAQAVPSAKALVPVDEDFGIVIPKIGANARVIADVDWENSAEYQRALTQGVAHARGTSYPGAAGNVFLFAHSGVDFYEANRYNAVFYLIGKLRQGDEIYLFHNREKFVYKVVETKIVASDQVEYLTGDESTKTLTLMTCWPAGTTFKRLIVIAEQVSDN